MRLLHGPGMAGQTIRTRRASAAKSLLKPTCIALLPALGGWDGFEALCPGYSRSLPAMKASDHQELTYNPRMHHAAPVRKTLSSVLCLQVYLPIACQTPAEGVIGYTSLTDHPMRFSLFSPVTSFLNVRSHIRAQGLQGVVDWRVCMETQPPGQKLPKNADAHAGDDRLL